VKIYIIRHGSTEQLENNQRQTLESKLSEQGLDQIRQIGKKLMDLEIDYFFCSPLKRTVESANIISKLIKIKAQKNNLLREVDHPNELYGANFSDQIVKKYDQQKLKWLTDLDWKFMNKGESLRDVINRTIDFKNEMISKYIDKNILIVSHAYAIRCLISACVMGDIFTDGAMLRMIHAVRISKASLSVLEYLPENKYFYINLLNDVTHLGKSDILSYGKK